MTINDLCGIDDCVTAVLSLTSPNDRNRAGYLWNRCINDLESYKTAVSFGELDIAQYALSDLQSDALRFMRDVCDDAWGDDSVDAAYTLASLLTYDYLNGDYE